MAGGVSSLSQIPAPTLDLSDRKDPKLELDTFIENSKNMMRVSENTKCVTELREKIDKCGTKEECTVAGLIKKDFCDNKISYNRSKPLEEHCKKMVEPSIKACNNIVEECRNNALTEFTKCAMPITNNNQIISEEKLVKDVTALGCFTDDKVGHMDMATKTVDIKMTQNMCIENCDKKNYKYAALQNGDTCLCANDTHFDNKKSAYSKVDDKECKMPCSGDPFDKKCGGVFRNAIYDVNSQKYLECRKDDKEGQFINYKYDKENKIPKCIEQCKKDNFKYAALQSGNWCACGNDMEFNKQKDTYRRILGTECNISCKGKTDEKCGGIMRNSIFRIENTK